MMAKVDTREGEYSSSQDEEMYSDSTCPGEDSNKGAESPTETPLHRSHKKGRKYKPGCAVLGFHRLSRNQGTRRGVAQMPMYLPARRDPSEKRSGQFFDEVLFRMMLRSPVQTEVIRGSSFLRLRRRASESSALYYISKRYEWYSNLQGSDRQHGLTVQGIDRMIRDIFRRSPSKAAARRVFARIDIQSSGYVSYEDFVSYLSLSWQEICQLAEDIVCFLLGKANAEGDEKHAYRLLAPSCREDISLSSLATFVQTNLEFAPTPGELNTLRTVLGMNCDGFCRRARSYDRRTDDCKYLQGLQKACKNVVMSEVQVCLSTLPAQRLAAQGFTQIEGTLQTVSKHQQRTLWVKCHSGSNPAESQAGQSVSEILRQDADVDTLKREVDAGPALYIVENLRLSHSPRDSRLVAQGFVRVLEPLNRGIGLKTMFLWFKRSLSSSSDFSRTRDCIIDMAITKGHSRRKHDPIWSPPYQGFKRLQVQLRDSCFGEDVFVWYLKRDKTYLKDALDSIQPSLRQPQDHSTVLKQLENHLRDQVRGHAREIARRQDTTLHKALETLVTKNMFKGLPKLRTYVSRREFVRIMTNLNVTISAKDIASIFNNLDLSGTGWVNKSDIIDFIFFSDSEIKSLVVKLRKKLWAYSKRKNGESTFTSLFQQMDKDGDLKLSSREFQDFLNKLNVKLAPDEVVRMVDQLDLNGNGQIDYFEFVSFINQAPEGKDQMVNRRIRAAARKLHKHLITTATLGHPCGKLGTDPDWDRAWRKLRGEINHRHRGKACFTAEGLRLWLNKVGCDVNPSETLELVNTIGGKAKVLDRETLISFASKFDPNEKPLLAKTRNRYENNAQAHGELQHDVNTALEALREALASIRKQGPLLSFFRLSEDSGLPCTKFAHRMRKFAVLKHLSTDDYMQVAAVLDSDGDGFICENDLRSFIRVGGLNKMVGAGSEVGLYRQGKHSPEEIKIDPEFESKEHDSDDSSEDGAGSWLEQKSIDATNDAAAEEKPRLRSALLRNKWIEHIDKCRKTSRGVNTVTGLDVDLLRAAVAEALSGRDGSLNLRKEFSKYDVRGDGEIALKHFRRVLSKARLLIPETQKKPLAKLVLDRHNGSCNYVRFCALVENVKADDISGTHERTWKLFKDKDYEFAFAAFDQLGEGFLTEDDFDQALGLLGVQLHKFDRAALFSILQDPIEPKRLNYLKLDELISLYQQSGNARTEREFDEGKLFEVCRSAMTHSEARTGAVDFYSYFEVYDEAGTGVVGIEEFVNGIKRLFADCSHGMALHSTDLDLLCGYCSQSQQQRDLSSNRRIEYSPLCEYLEGVSEIVEQGIDKASLLAEFKKALLRLSSESGIAFNTLLSEFRLLNGKTSRTAFRTFLNKLGLTMEERNVLKLMALANTEDDGTVDVDYLVSIASTENRQDWTAIQDNLRSVVRRATTLNPHEDVRLLFNHTNGIVTFSAFADGLKKLGLYLLREDCLGFYQHLSKGNNAANAGVGTSLSVEDLSAALEHEEEDLDLIATRLAKRIIELEHDGVNVSEELLARAENGSNSSCKTLSWTDFVKVATKLGLPLSRADLEILARRFSSPESKLFCRFEDLLDFSVFRYRSLAVTSASYRS